MNFDTPILIIIFNRPDFALKLYKIIENIKPLKLYIISDGPRNQKELQLVDQSRNLFENIKWNCDVKYNYLDENIGLRKRISEGISWVFGFEEKLIILEDDCIPNLDFFKYCEELLIKYQHETRIMTINGCNLNPNISKNFPESYFFTKYANSWGWATWKRAWNFYDNDLIGLSRKDLINFFVNLFKSGYRPAYYWRYKLNKVKKNKINSWAFRWMFTLWVNNGLAIVPQTNLIQNIGNDKRSTNTKGNFHFLDIASVPMGKKQIEHPHFIKANYKYDKWQEDAIHSKSLKYRLIWLLKKLTLQI